MYNNYRDPPTRFAPSISIAALATRSATGVVQNIDEANHLLTLADRTNYRLPRNFTAEGMVPGSKVCLCYEVRGGDRQIATIRQVF